MGGFDPKQRIKYKIWVLLKRLLLHSYKVTNWVTCLVSQATAIYARCMHTTHTHKYNNTTHKYTAHTHHTQKNNATHTTLHTQTNTHSTHTTHAQQHTHNTDTPHTKNTNELENPNNQLFIYTINTHTIIVSLQ